MKFTVPRRAKARVKGLSALTIASALFAASCGGGGGGGGDDAIDAHQSPLAGGNASCATRINDTREKLLQCVTLPPLRQTATLAAPTSPAPSPTARTAT